MNAKLPGTGRLVGMFMESVMMNREKMQFVARPGRIPHRLACAPALLFLLLVPGIRLFGAEPAGAHQTLERYLAGAASNAGAEETAMRLNIEASLPGMHRSGVLQALEYIPRSGKSLVRVMKFQGDTTVKRQVIARYLSAEAEAHQRPSDTLALTRANYNFRYLRSADYNGHAAWVYQVQPRGKRTGLFQGELWIDAATAAPLRQWGVFVKNPSLFIKRVYFVRDYDLATAAPRRLIVNLDTRIAGAADLTIWYEPVASGPEAMEVFGGVADGF